MKGRRGITFLGPTVISMCSICFIHFENVDLAPSKRQFVFLFVIKSQAPAQNLICKERAQLMFVKWQN